MSQYWPTGLVRFLIRRPRSMPDVIRAAWRLRRDAWYRTAPFLPVPDEAYWQFRRATALGNEGRSLTASEVVDAARWAARQPVGR